MAGGVFWHGEWGASHFYGLSKFRIGGGSRPTIFGRNEGGVPIQCLSGERETPRFIRLVSRRTSNRRTKEREREREKKIEAFRLILLSRLRSFIETLQSRQREGEKKK